MLRSAVLTPTRSVSPKPRPERSASEAHQRWAKAKADSRVLPRCWVQLVGAMIVGVNYLGPNSYNRRE